MAKYALLIGVSTYEGLNNLPGTQKDIEEMQRILQDSDIGNFDEVKLLHNPSDPTVMQIAIQTLFSERQRDDLLLLYFSGHGITDNNGRLYLATCKTHKNLFEATTVPASFVHNIISISKSKRQVIILDCCYSGAFAKDWSFKSSNSFDIQAQLGGEGRAVLTSCTAVEYSIEQEGAGVYTRYLIEGIQTGAADTDNDGQISIDELHEYAKKKVHEAAPAMKPEIYAVKEGYKIKLAKAPLGDPKLVYRKEVEFLVDEDNGEISPVSRSILDDLRKDLGLLPEATTAIEDEVLEPYREKQSKLHKYRQLLSKAIEYEYPLSESNRNKLSRLQQRLQLRDEDIAAIVEDFKENNQKTLLASLTDYKKLANNLILNLRILRSFSEKLNIQQSLASIDSVLARIENRTFWVAVVGEFRRGKTTLINAFLGEEILASYNPFSATINRFTYSLNKYVEVEFKDGRKEKVEIDKLSEYMTKLTPEAVAANVKGVVVYYPASYCKKNIDIIDTPTFNDNLSMTRVTLSVLQNVDVAILVIMAQTPFSEVEGDFLVNKLLTNGLGHVIFVVTGIDRCNRPGDADKVIASVRKRIKEYVLGRAAEQWGEDSPEYEVYLKKIGEPKVFGLSAYQALEAKENNDDELLAKSRFTEFEQALEQFLAKERGAIELQVSLNRVITSSGEILSTINIQENALLMKLKDFEKTYETSVQEISELRRRRKEAMQLIDRASENVRYNVRPLLNKLEDDLKQTAIQVIDSTTITPKEMSNKKALAEKLGRKVSSSLQNAGQKLADKIQTEIQKELTEMTDRLKFFGAEMTGRLNFLGAEINGLIVLNALTTINISVLPVLLAGGWFTRIVFGGEQVEAFKENYKAAILKEIEKQMKSNSIIHKVEEHISTSFDHLKETLSQEVEALLDNTQNTLTELNRKRQVNETLTEAQEKELDEIRTETERILGSAQRRSQELMEIMSV
jgi:GTPase SAR1 family protein